MLLKKLSKYIANNKQTSVTNKKRISELQNILSNLEERFVLNEITKVQYDKFTSKYSNELNQLMQEIKSNANTSSNLEKAVEKGLKIAENISQLWGSSDYYEKQQLQYLLFPEGILYDKKNDTVRTNRINTLFHEISVNKRVLDKTKKDNPLLNYLFGSNVGMTGLFHDPEKGVVARIKTSSAAAVFVFNLRRKVNFTLVLKTKIPDNVQYFFGRDDWIRTSDP